MNHMIQNYTKMAKQATGTSAWARVLPVDWFFITESYGSVLYTEELYYISLYCARMVQIPK